MALKKVYVLGLCDADLPQDVENELQEYGTDQECSNGYASYFSVKKDSVKSNYPLINQYLLDEGVNPDTDNVLIHISW